MIPVRNRNSGEITYVTRSKAKVIDNRDPEKRGRIRINHPIIGESAWIPYLKTPGLFDVPEINDVVYIEADCGHPTHCLAWGNLANSKDDNFKVPEEFKRSIPTNRGLYSPSGHKLELDDGKSYVTGNDPKSKRVTLEDKGIRLTSSSGNKIWIIEEESSGIQHILIEDNKGNKIELVQNSNDALNISVTGNVNINCTNANITAANTATIEASNVKLGQSAIESVIKGDTFSAFYNTHTHISAAPGSPTSTPVVPMTAAQLSSKVKTE